LKRHKIDKGAEKIVRAIIQDSEARQKRKRSGRQSEFDILADEAIAQGKNDLHFPDCAVSIRKHLINKICDSLANSTPWETLGETYCCRRLFYAYRKEFSYLVAKHLKVIRNDNI
jgi:hypothetical protein